MKNGYERMLSQNEQYYVEINEESADMVMKIIIEGEGELNLEEFKSAVTEVSNICKESRFVLKNKCWIDSKITPNIIVETDEDFNGYNFDESKYFFKKHNPKKNGNCEIIIFSKKPIKILFRIFHGIMDARGAQHWIENIFRKLNSMELIETNSFSSDLEFVKKSIYCKEKNKLDFDCELVDFSYGNRDKTLYYNRITIEKKFNGLIAKIAFITSSLFKNSNSRFLVPVDLRKHDKNVISVSNLLLPVYINADKGMNWLEIYKDMVSKIDKKKELNISNADFGLLFEMPKWIRKLIIKYIIRNKSEKNRFLNSGTLSNIGRVDLSRFSTEKFIATAFYVLPTHQPLVPFSITTTEAKDKTEIVFSSYENIISRKYSRKIIEQLQMEIMKI